MSTPLVDSTVPAQGGSGDPGLFQSPQSQRTIYQDRRENKHSRSTSGVLSFTKQYVGTVRRIKGDLDPPSSRVTSTNMTPDGAPGTEYEVEPPVVLKVIKTLLTKSNKEENKVSQTVSLSSITLSSARESLDLPYPILTIDSQSIFYMLVPPQRTVKTVCNLKTDHLSRKIGKTRLLRRKRNWFGDSCHCGFRKIRLWTEGTIQRPNHLNRISNENKSPSRHSDIL